MAATVVLTVARGIIVASQGCSPEWPLKPVGLQALCLAEANCLHIRAGGRFRPWGWPTRVWGHSWKAGAGLPHCRGHVWRAAASWCFGGLHKQAGTCHRQLNCLSLLQVPGYGLAVAGAQYAIADLVKTLASKGVQVRSAGLTAQPLQLSCNTCHSCC